MADRGAIMRAQYRNLSTGTVRSGSTGHGESLTDVEAYLLPASRARTSGLTRSGVVGGLVVQGTVGDPGLTVSPGTALDTNGRTIMLAAGGAVIVDPAVDPDAVENVPTVPVPADGISFSTEGAAEDSLLTLTWREVASVGVDANGPVLLHAPWLRLVPSQDFDPGGSQVVLATVTLEAAGGAIAALSEDGRRLVSLVSQRLELWAPDQQDAEVIGQRPAAELLVRADGALELNLLHDGGARPALHVHRLTREVVFGGSLQVTSPNGSRHHRMAIEDDGRLRFTDVDSGADRLTVDAEGQLGINLGAGPAERIIHTEGSEIHSGGPGGGFSFANRGDGGQFVGTPAHGERWVWHAQGGKARLWSGKDILTVASEGLNQALEVRGRARLTVGDDASAGFWLAEKARPRDRAFIGMKNAREVGFWGNLAGQWGMTMDVETLAVSMPGEFGGFGIPSTLTLFGSRIGDLGGGVLFIKSGGPVISLESNVGVHNRNPQTPLDVIGPGVAITGRGGPGAFQAGVHGLGNIGVWAQGSNNGILAAGPNFAGVFLGRVQITDELVKLGGGFRIDHPLAPAQKYLSHSFVESPERLNLYAGLAETGEDGLVTVELPEYFAVLNRDICYQLTPIGEPVAVSVAEPLRDNRFSIRADRPGVRVSWQVTGVRQDAWAEANPLVVEEDKPLDEQNRFLHPDVLGEPDSRHLFFPVLEEAAGPEAESYRGEDR